MATVLDHLQAFKVLWEMYTLPTPEYLVSPPEIPSTSNSTEWSTAAMHVLSTSYLLEQPRSSAMVINNITVETKEDIQTPKAKSNIVSNLLTGVGITTVGLATTIFLARRTTEHQLFNDIEQAYDQVSLTLLQTRDDPNRHFMFKMPICSGLIIKRVFPVVVSFKSAV